MRSYGQCGHGNLYYPDVGVWRVPAREMSTGELLVWRCKIEAKRWSYTPWGVVRMCSSERVLICGICRLPQLCTGGMVCSCDSRAPGVVAKRATRRGLVES